MLTRFASLSLGLSVTIGAHSLRGQTASRPSAGPLWTRGATCYEVFVRSFYDSDGDGVGDFNGLTQKLDYINDGKPASRHSLGARCIWLMPIAESPSYHGYDVTDYYKVDHEYGTAEDFKRFMAAAHKRGIHVLVDMVLNHSASNNPWFQAALRDPSSPYRSWYRFSATKPNELGPWGQPVWHKSPLRDEYFYGVFYEGMPDLDYRNPAVVDEAKKIARFWIEEMGVDGFRLDAVPYLVEDSGRLFNTPETHAVLADYSAYVRSIKPDVYTVGEVWSPIDTVLSYYPNQLESYFAFEVSDSLINAARTGNARGVLSPVLRLQRDVPAARWSPFLRNHDQTRTRTELKGDINKSRMAAFLLLTLPGVPFVYYGEEIGMIGDKPDERIRTPMQWTSGRAGGFTRGTPWESLQNDSAVTTVAAQDDDVRSLLGWYRQLIHLRASTGPLAVGEVLPLDASNDAVAAYLRRDGSRTVLVVANLGSTTLSNVTLSSDVESAPIGTWHPTALFGAKTAATLTIGADGRIARYTPVATLEPFTGYIFELR